MATGADATQGTTGALGARDIQAVMRSLSPAGTADDLFRALFDDAPVAYGLLGLDGQQVHANRAYHELFGYEPGEMEGVDMLALTHPDDRDLTAVNLQRLASGGTSAYELEKRYVRKDGSVFWGHVVASTLCDSNGDPWALLGAVEDISDRMAALAALAESESRLRALVQHASDPIVVTDALGTVVFATPSTEHVSGVPIADVLGTSVLDWVHEDDRDVVAESFLAAAAVPGPPAAPVAPLQLRIRRRDGGIRFIEVVATNLLEDPAVGGIVLNLRDLTDTQVSNSALEMTEIRFKHLVENISDTITVIDDHGHVVLSTGNLRSILGYETAFWDERNVFDILHPDDVERMSASFVEILSERGKEMAGEARVRDAFGSWVDVEINAVNLLDDESVHGIVLTTRNITARKRYEDELAHARDQAVRALQMRTEFIASVSHELRTPIHGVLGLAELLVTADLDDEARGLARSISRATESLRMVLDDILDFSKIEVGRLEINHEPVSLTEVAQDVEALFGAQAAAKGTRLVTQRAADVPEWILSDGLRIRQVLNNLVGNAIKFTVEGEVVVSATRVSDEGGTDLVRITVRDTGIGIALDKHDRLFEPFSQAHQSTREYGGTGLGLSIARRLVELMGGRLDFRSAPGSGSEFWFVLPLVPVDAGAEPHLATVDRAQGRPIAMARVMVVEDNPINQLLVQRQLERLGYEATVFDNGLAALDAFPSSPCDVVLMDWQLPGIDGLETTRRLRAFEREHGRAPVPIVAMTASALPGDRNRCIEAGMDDFIAKPVSMVTLGRVVQRWCRRGGPVDAGTGVEDGVVPPADDASSSSAPPDGARPDRPAPGLGPGPESGSESGSGPAASGRAGAPRGPDSNGAGGGVRGGAAAADRQAAVPPVSTTVWSRIGATAADSEGDPETLPVLDVAALDRLVDELVDPLLVVTVGRTYLRELAGRLRAIEAAISDDDRPALAAAAHTLKSTSAAVGATKLSELCLRLEQTARLSATVALPVAADDVHGAADAVERELERALARLESTAAAPALGTASRAEP